MAKYEITSMDRQHGQDILHFTIINVEADGEEVPVLLTQIRVRHGQTPAETDANIEADIAEAVVRWEASQQRQKDMPAHIAKWVGKKGDTNAKKKP